MKGNKEISEILHKIEESDAFLIASHVDPDGDAIGSLLGLSMGLKSIGKEIWPFIHAPLNAPFSLLPGTDLIKVELPLDLSRFVCIALDCANLNRLGSLRERLSMFPCVINIDHHVTNPGYGHLNWVDPTSSCVGEMVMQLLMGLGVTVNEEIAAALYYAIQTDTGGFRFENTTQGSLEAAFSLVANGLKPWNLFKRLINTTRPQRLRLLCKGVESMEFLGEGSICFVGLTKDMFEVVGAEPEDAADLVEVFRSIQGVQVAVVARETSPGLFKFSMRSDGSVDLAKLATAFGGGGHRMAAGFEFVGDLTGAKERLKRLIMEEINL